LDFIKLDKVIYAEDIKKELFHCCFNDYVQACENSQPVVVKALLFQHNWAWGSSESLKFHLGLYNSMQSYKEGPPEYFKTDTIRAILYYKWDQVYFQYNLMALFIFLAMITVGFGGMALEYGYLPIPVVATMIGIAGAEQTIRAVA